MTKYEAQAVILFDGVCNFCNGAVQWIISRDSNAYFHFASLQSKVADTLFTTYGIKEKRLDSIVLIEEGRYYTESSAVLRICKGLGGWWRLLYGFIVIPRPIRDVVYRWVAKNRYRFRGKKEQCMIPSPDIRKRFLDD
ncbi:thiol-disulfide oxidoreductase DCC family protein [Hazenella coriacea]|uniref:Putative DCC family thiol-disulfide oxidoreductase YuxK n=1 Tax=Hazenella coriacea TaxID=1179467 RepID=A0A4R3L3C0_9BACL|nr:thiol-disulfide oxidoreductase DCC family protein [Hazenella coriacea]TCS91982.1 putative DCC family thiol-disulfide oxidoreductase YuxK [Hazenella coriacea]